MTKLCQCCKTRPIAKYKQKYCEICSKYNSQISQAKKRGADISQLGFTGNKLCADCGKRPIAKGNKQFCEVCSKYHSEYYHRVRLQKDLEQSEQGKLLSSCRKCGIRPRRPGSSYCIKCNRNRGREYMAKTRGQEVFVPKPRPKHIICTKCHQQVRYNNQRAWCLNCIREFNRIYNFTGRSPYSLKPVANPEAYYTEASVKLNCPVCNAEACLPNLPLGKYCQQKIINNSNFKVWQRILEIKGIRVPSFVEIAPEVAEHRATCIRCRQNFKRPGWLYCSKCWEIIQSERKQEVSI